MCYGNILEEGMRKARREHTCGACSKPILAGDTYSFQVIARDGGLDTWKVHRRCDALLTASNPFDYDGCMVMEPREHLRETAIYGGWRALLAAARKAFVRRTRKASA